MGLGLPGRSTRRDWSDGIATRSCRGGVSGSSNRSSAQSDALPGWHRAALARLQGVEAPEAAVAEAALPPFRREPDSPEQEDQAATDGSGAPSMEELEAEVEAVAQLVEREASRMRDLQRDAAGRRAGQALDDLVAASRRRGEAPSLTFLTTSNEQAFDVAQRPERYPNYQHEVRLRRAEQARQQASQELHRKRARQAAELKPRLPTTPAQPSTDTVLARPRALPACGRRSGRLLASASRQLLS